MKEKYISLLEFSQICGKSMSTIKRRKDIVGITADKQVLVGTRYPMSIRRFQIVDDYDKRFVLLKAISENKYVDAKMLCVYDYTFANYLKDYEKMGLIRNNKNENPYGANCYDCTNKGAELAKKNKKAFKAELTTLLTTIIGTCEKVLIAEISK